MTTGMIPWRRRWAQASMRRASSPSRRAMRRRHCSRLWRSRGGGGAIELEPTEASDSTRRAIARRRRLFEEVLGSIRSLSDAKEAFAWPRRMMPRRSSPVDTEPAFSKSLGDTPRHFHSLADTFARGIHQQR
eukprot:UN4666